MNDLASVQSHTKRLDILHPGTGEEIGLRVELLPPDDPKIKAAIRRLADMRRHKAQRNQIASAADDERASFEVCRVAVVGWEWTKEDASWNGDQPAFSATVLSEMLERDWFRLQVDREMAVDQGFF